jgi:putative addiction module component (TIGR02574 family)
MNEQVKELAEQGRALAPDDRSRLVDMLLVSLQESSLAETQSSWDVEIERRLAAFDNGELHALEGEQVLAQARVHAGR